MSTPNIYPTDPVKIVLADGVERHLRYTLGSVRRIKAQYGKTLQEILAQATDEALPGLIFEGLVEKTENAEALLDLIETPMIEYVMRCFVEAFSGKAPKNEPASQEPATVQ